MSNKELGIFFDTVIPQFVERRKTLGLSQSRLDEMIGCARGLVSKWEVGIRKPSGFLFCCWANALECHIKIKPKETELQSEHISTH